MDEEKEKPGRTVEEGIVIAVVVFLVFVALGRIINYFNQVGASGSTSTYLESITGGPNGWYTNSLHYINVVISTYVMIATIFCIITFMAMLYVAWLTYRLEIENVKKDKEAVAEKAEPSIQSQKWQTILTHANSQNPAEWRLSILEADVMLDDMLSSLGYHGESIGDKLKGIEKADFKTIDMAWEAHKIRNLIAHEGADFAITERDAKRVIGLYEQAFKEFSYV